MRETLAHMGSTHITHPVTLSQQVSLRLNNLKYIYFTLIPVLVASFTAASRLSYLGLKDTVNAQSIILPEKQKTFFYKLSTALSVEY